MKPSKPKRLARRHSKLKSLGQIGLIVITIRFDPLYKHGKAAARHVSRGNKTSRAQQVFPGAKLVPNWGVESWSQDIGPGVTQPTVHVPRCTACPNLPNRSFLLPSEPDEAGWWPLVDTLAPLGVTQNVVMRVHDMAKRLGCVPADYMQVNTCSPVEWFCVTHAAPNNLRDGRPSLVEPLAADKALL